MSAAGVGLFVRSDGDGPPLLVLHGFTGSGAGMEALCERLAPERRTLRLDLLGHGASDAPRDVRAYAMERCVEQVAAALDTLDAPRADVLGYSMGGRVALALCAWRPGRVRRAVLIGAGAGIADPEARAARLRDDEALAARIERDGVPAFVAHWEALPLFASQRRLPEAARARLRAERLANRPHGLAHSLRGMGSGAQPPLHEQLAAVDAPVLLLAGEHDAKFRALAADLAARLPRGRAAVVPGAGHACHLEAPAHTAELALAFLAETEASARGPARPAPHHPLEASP